MKSFRQQNLSSTIKYPEMLAQIRAYLDGNEIPDFGKDNLLVLVTNFHFAQEQEPPCRLWQRGKLTDPIDYLFLEQTLWCPK